MTLKESTEAFAVKKALAYLDKNPEENLPKLLDWFDRFDRKDTLKMQRESIRKVIADKENNWYRLIMSLWKDIDPGVRLAFGRWNVFDNDICQDGAWYRCRSDRYCYIVDADSAA